MHKGSDKDHLAKERTFVEALARRLVLDPHAADDLVQETLLAAMKDPPQRSRRGWLARVVRNLAYRQLRADERRRRREHAVARPDAEPPTADLVARVAWHRRVVDTLLSLDEPYRTTLLLRFYEDLQPKEIGERLGIPAATIRTRLKRGLQQMRERLDGEHGGRRNWCLALLPVAFAPRAAVAAPIGAASTATGVIIVSAKTKWILAASLLAALLGTAGLATRSQGERDEVARSTTAREPAEPPIIEEKPKAEALDAATVPFTVRVEDRFGKPIPSARVEVLDRRVRTPRASFPASLWREIALARTRGERRDSSFTANAEGEVALGASNEQVFDLRVSHPGHATATLSVWGTHLGYRVVVLGPGHRLDGRVLDVHGTPVPGALVLVAPDGAGWSLGSGGPPLRAVADEQGRYSFDSLPGRPLAIHAARPEQLPILIGRLRFPQLSSFDIVVPEVGSLAGFVRTPDGNPVSGAAVSAIGNSGAFLAFAKADATGAYRMDSVPVGRVRTLDLRCEGFAPVVEPQRIDVRIVAGEQSKLDGTMTPGASLRGIVRGAGGPVAGAWLWSFQDGGFAGAVSCGARTNDRGEYILGDLPAGRNLLEVWQPGYESVRANSSREALQQPDHPLVVELIAGEERTRDFELRRCEVQVEGLVTGPDGEPVPGAYILARWSTAHCDGDGRFSILVDEGDSLRVFARDLELVGDSFRIEGSASLSGVELRMREKRETIVSGVVRGARGEAWVAMIDAPRGVRSFASWAYAEIAAVDAEGRYEIPVRSPRGARLLRVEGSEGLPTEPQRLEFEVGRDRYTVDFAIDEGHTIRGRSLPGARIFVLEPRNVEQSILTLTSNPMVAIVEAVADANGEFLIHGVSAGKHEVCADRAGCIGVSKHVDIPLTEPIALMPRPSVEIGGVVVFEDGAPAVGATVQAVEHETGSGSGSMKRRGQIFGQSTVTNAQGRWTIDGMHPGGFRVTVYATDECNLIRKKIASVPDGKSDLRIIVQRAFEIHGCVVDGSGVGVAGVRISAQTKRGKGAKLLASDTSDSNGSFRIRGLPGGPVHLALDGTSMHWDYGTVAAGTADLRIVFDPSQEDLGRTDVFWITGRLIDPEGKPVAGARIQARHTGDPDVPRILSGETGEDGNFALPRMPQGRYRLVLMSHGDVGWAFRELGEYAAGTRDLTIRLRRGATFSGRVVDENGSPIEHVFVSAFLANDDYASDKTGADGRFLVGAFADGTKCTLRAHCKGFIYFERENVAAGTENIEIVMKQGFEVQGIVASGPRAEVRLVWIEDEKRVRTVKADHLGRFRVDSLRPGRYRVTVNGEPAGTVEAGDLDVKLAVK